MGWCKKSEKSLYDMTAIVWRWIVEWQWQKCVKSAQNEQEILKVGEFDEIDRKFCGL